MSLLQRTGDCVSATDVVTVYVFQEPSLLSSLQDKGLTDVVLHALLIKDVRPCVVVFNVFSFIDYGQIALLLSFFERICTMAELEQTFLTLCKNCRVRNGHHHCIWEKCQFVCEGSIC